MEKITIKTMIEKSDIPAKLIRSTINQLGGFESFKESARDITRHGIDGGFHGFIYYSDTMDFFKRNRKDILVILQNDVECFGSSGLLEFIKSFNCANDCTIDEIARAIYQGKGDCVEQVYNCLAWYAGETVCRLYDDLTQDD